MQSNCPECNCLNLATSDKWIDFMPVECHNCSTIYWCSIHDDIEEVPIFPDPYMQEQIPELDEGTRVILSYKGHPYHLHEGEIIKRDHKHYRLIFEDGMKMWFPDNMIIKIPDSL